MDLVNDKAVENWVLAQTVSSSIGRLIISCLDNAPMDPKAFDALLTLVPVAEQPTIRALSYRERDMKVMDYNELEGDTIKVVPGLVYSEIMSAPMTYAD
jgi:hypothetical protein